MLFRVTILGCNSAIPTTKRNPTAQLLNVSERYFLIDCGEGTQMQLRKNNIKIQKINHVFISHMHGDHYFGLIGLISTMHLLGRTKELHIYGPSILKEIIQLQLSASNTELCYPLFFHPLTFESSSLIMEDDNIEVYTIPLRHSISCCGFLFKEKQKLRKMIKDKIKEYNIPSEAIQSIKEGADFEYLGHSISCFELTKPAPVVRSYAFCSDTAYDERIISIIRDTDLLYHEATFMNNLKERAEQTLHSTTGQAASIASQANVKRLVIGHYSSRYTDLEPLLIEAQSVFPNTELAKEGIQYEIPLSYVINS